jgi:hypothetical protein
MNFRATPEHILRKVEQELESVMALPPAGEPVTIPRIWLVTWQAHLVTVRRFLGRSVGYQFLCHGFPWLLVGVVLGMVICGLWPR